MRAARIVVVLVLAVALLAAIAPDEPAAARVRPFDRVAVLFLENHGYDQIVGSPQAPYLNRLARRGALATQYYALAHPSVPNYLALTTGSTHGMTSDCNSCDASGPSLAGQLDAAHVSWRAYFESIPARGYEGRGAGTYTKHYNPFAYSERSGDAVGRRHVLGFGSLRHDLRRGTLPRFSWIAPNLAHDGHNGSVRASDRFAARARTAHRTSARPGRRAVRDLGRGPGRTGPRRRPRGADRDRPGSTPGRTLERPGRPLLAAGHPRGGWGCRGWATPRDAPVAPVTALLRG